jgi:hypothetical protein
MTTLNTPCKNGCFVKKRTWSQTTLQTTKVAIEGKNNSSSKTQEG